MPIKISSASRGILGSKQSPSSHVDLTQLYDCSVERPRTCKLDLTESRSPFLVRIRKSIPIIRSWRLNPHVLRSVVILIVA